MSSHCSDPRCPACKAIAAALAAATRKSGGKK
jgi:hypothetical protein